MSPRFSSFGSLLNATLLGAGLAILAGVIWVGSTGFIRSWWRASWFPGNESPYQVEDVAFRKDGTPLFRGTRRSEKSYSAEMVAMDLDEKVLDDIRWDDLLDSCYLIKWDPRQAMNVGWRQRILVYTDGLQPPVYWYFVHNGLRDGKGWLEGYTTGTQQRIGYLGKNGLQAEPVPGDAQFEVTPRSWSLSGCVVSLQWGGPGSSYPIAWQPFQKEEDIQPWDLFVLSNDGIYRADLRSHTVSKVFDATGTTLLSAGIHNTRQPDKKEYIRHLAVRTPERVLFMKGNGETVAEAILPEALRQAGEINLFKQDNGNLIAAVTDGRWEGEKYRRTTQVTWFDPQGSPLSTQIIEVPTSLRRQPDMHWEAAYFWAAGAPLSADFGFLVIAPFEGMWSGRSYLGSIQAACEDLRQSGIGNPYWLVPLLHLYTLLWAFLAWKRETRYGSSPRQRWMWTVFVYLLGLPALIGYLAHRKWPKLEECPGCKASTPVDREGCLTCGTPWAVPERTGIEVIEV